MTNPETNNGRGKQFEKASAAKRADFLGEFPYFLDNSKKWWLTPIIGIFLVLGLLVVLAGTGAAPFIYTVW